MNAHKSFHCRSVSETGRVEALMADIKWKGTTPHHGKTDMHFVPLF